jgi:SH3-like domain-containing protein
MFARTLKTAAIAAVAIVATATASMAAQYAWVDFDAKVKAQPKNKAQTVNWVQEGQKVAVVAYAGGWAKVKIPGQDGWVKTSALDYAPFPNNKPWPNNNNNGSVCINGQYGYICLGN